MAETYAFGRAILRDVEEVELDYRRISRSSDQSFWGAGVPTIFATLSEQVLDQSPTAAALGQLLGGGGRSGGLGWWWHTTEDTLDKIDQANLLRDARIYAEAIWQLCTLEHLPFDYAAAADEMARALVRYQETTNGSLGLSTTITLARRLREDIRAFPWDQLTAEHANALTVELGHTLIPVNYTRSGQFEHDLALGSQAMPGRADVPQLHISPRPATNFISYRQG